jgi:hypothetical protein
MQQRRHLEWVVGHKPLRIRIFAVSLAGVKERE